MRKGGGKEKGRTFEVQVAKAVSLWWTDGKDKDAFWRNAGSGGRVHKVATPYSGDICPVKDNAKPWRLHIECKKREDWSFEGILKQNMSEPLWSFIGQVEYDCTLAKRVGLLIFTRNRDEWYVYMPLFCWFDLAMKVDLLHKYNSLHVIPSIDILNRFKEKYGKEMHMTGEITSWQVFTKYYSKEKLGPWLKEFPKRLTQTTTAPKL